MMANLSKWSATHLNIGYLQKIQKSSSINDMKLCRLVFRVPTHCLFVFEIKQKKKNRKNFLARPRKEFAWEFCWCPCITIINNLTWVCSHQKRRCFIYLNSSGIRGETHRENPFTIKWTTHKKFLFWQRLLWWNHFMSRTRNYHNFFISFRQITSSGGQKCFCYASHLISSIKRNSQDSTAIQSKSFFFVEIIDRWSLIDALAIYSFRQFKVKFGANFNFCFLLFVRHHEKQQLLMIREGRLRRKNVDQMGKLRKWSWETWLLKVLKGRES